VSKRLYLVEDDLFFSQRVLAASGRLGVTLEGLSPAVARSRAWVPGDVVVLQATLRPDHQLELVEELARRHPAPIVVAVTGHLETALRQRLKAAGAVLAAHSAMDRVLARALAVNDRGGADAPPDHRA
jgi:ActR/RegA family two-component response regulator